MYIQKVTIENVKSFSGEHEFILRPGVNYFVGDNNSGKSTILEALLFLFEGPTANRWTPEDFYCSRNSGRTRVEVDIVGELDELVAQSKFIKLKNYIFENNGEKTLRLERNSQERTIKQKGKDKKLDAKSIGFWNPENQQFENITGIDALAKALFDFETVWADANPDDHIDFTSKKTLGRLLDTSFQTFVNTDPWKELVTAHKKAFSEESEVSFVAETQKIASEIKDLLDQQYGEAEYRFDFGLPDASTFMRQGSLHVDDGAGETPISGKGTGMQRAVALGIIQLYARKAAATSDKSTAPLILMLDEPETWLHPSAQLRLGDAISRIGEHEQVFVVTHSPYLIRKFDSKNHLLTVLTGKGDARKIDSSTNFGLFGVGEPTWGEINYKAFQVCSNDFHNELYGYVQRYLDGRKTDGSPASEKELNNYLCEEMGIEENKTWVRKPTFSYPVTLPVYIRNSIHHPENHLNTVPSAQELDESTKLLFRVVENIINLTPASR